MTKMTTDKNGHGLSQKPGGNGSHMKDTKIVPATGLKMDYNRTPQPKRSPKGKMG